MAVTYELEERRVIPNWREYKRTLILGELNSDGKPSAPFEIDIQRAISDWSISKSIGTAADLVNAAFISGKFKQQEVTEAISFIHAHENESSQSLIDLAKIIASSSSNTGQDSVENRKELLAIGVDSIEEFQSIRDVKAFHKILHKTRLRAYNELYNPILWVELARQYSIVGQEKKAEHAMETALYLAPSNRFVLRSATRCFVHIGKLEKAVFYLRKNISTKHDPWLISAHIATSSMMGRYSPLIKDGIALLKSNNFSNFSTTELASSLGTIELKEGSFKKTKQFFDKALLAPNDNTLAQIEWASKEDRRLSINPFNFQQVINPFEAYSLEQFRQGNWKEALDNTMKWFLDMPYSQGPVLLGSYIASSLLNDSETAIRFCRAGLSANPNDPVLLNNLVYSLAISGRENEGLQQINSFMHLKFDSLPNESKIVFQATLGLVAFRNKEISTGKKFYELAILNAERVNNAYLKNLAIVNYTRELILNDCQEKETFLNRVRSIVVKPNEKDLEILKAAVLDLSLAPANKTANE